MLQGRKQQSLKQETVKSNAVIIGPVNSFYVNRKMKRRGKGLWREIIRSALEL